MDFGEFIKAHEGDDLIRLMLCRDRWPGVDMNLVVDTIVSRRKLRSKVPEWYAEPSLHLPVPLSAEQCSSSKTAAYKASVAARILSSDSEGSMSVGSSDFKWIKGSCIADLTGGLGVDSQALSKVAEKVIYNEMNPRLAEAARVNFPILGMHNVRISQAELTPESLGGILGDDSPDLIFLDPARRDEEGKKVFLLEDCSPDILTLMKQLFCSCRHILLKISPMADITMLIARLSHVRELHVVAAEGECKELLLWLDREWDGDCSMILCESGSVFAVKKQVPSPSYLKEVDLLSICIGAHLFVPGKALSKSGVADLICDEDCAFRLGRFTNLYVVPELPIKNSTYSSLENFGRKFRIVDIVPLNRRGMKEVSEKWPNSSITARNLPIDTAHLRRKMGISEGEDARIFACRVDFASGRTGNYIFVTRWEED